MSFIKRLIPAACALAMTAPAIQAVGWPANHQGVMLQGFYWDSYTDTKWTNLESQADELSQYFNLIWIPNSGNCGGGNNMGYMPQYWFTNHNSSFGSEAELLSMISTFKAKGTGFIADVVINHRVGTSNWTNFPTEQWNGQTWSIGPEGICSTDEVRNESGQARPTGAPDTGDDFNGARDLDHTNANVQNNCKNYAKCLLEKYGYVGFRYDMVKGYGGQYTKIYNQYSQPTYSVGEYWDANYDAVAGWIDATGRESAAFDFPGKYAINEAFSTGDMTKLVWKANGTTNQPAGMIHFGYAQLAVTFVDNHDTYRDGSKFNGNVVAANAFILCSPGTPCVFLPHWKAYKAEIKKLIEIRNAVGVHNCSAVNVLQSSNNCYMAEVTGTKGKLVVKIGSAQVSPAGYSNSDIKASGNDYCVWSKVGGVTPDPDPEPDPTPGDTYVYADVNWGNTVYAYIYDETANPKIENNNWPGVQMTKDSETGYWKYTVPANLKQKGLVILNTNGGSRYPADQEAGMALNGKTMIFHATGNKWEEYTGSVNPNPNPNPDPEPEPESDKVVVFYNNQNTNWTTPQIHYWGGDKESSWPGEKMTKVGEHVWMFSAPKGTTGVIFNSNGTQTEDYAAKNGHVYNFGEAKNYAGEHFAGDTKLYVVGNIDGAHWDTSAAIEMTRNGLVYTAVSVVLKVQPAEAARAAGEPKAYFSIISTRGADWDAVNTGNRFGAATEDADATTDNNITFYHKDVNGSSAKSWAVEPNTYDIKADFSTMKLTVTKSAQTNSTDMTITETADPVYYNLQGIEVPADNMAPGIYIERRGTTTRKIMVR